MSSANAPEADSQLQAPVVSPALRKRLQQCYDHARKLMAQPKYDFDYAHTMLAECVAGDPATLPYLDAFFENLAKKYDNNKKGARLQMFLNRGPFKKAVAAKQWRDVIRAGTEILKTNPWDIATLRGMAEACEQMQLNESELRFLKNALDGNPKDVDVNRHCAKSLARMGQFDQAIACWARVSEVKRNDPEAEKMIGDLQIEKTRWKFGMVSPEERAKRLGTAASASATLTPTKPQAAAEPIEPKPTEPKPPETPVRREVQLTEWQKLEQAISGEPAVVENYLRLAEVYADLGRVSDAERTLQRGLAASGSDLRIRERLEEVHVERVKHQLAIAQKRAQVESTESAKELVAQLKENLNRVELELLSRRAERYPAEPRWKLELAIRLKRAKNYSEALKQLQEVEKGGAASVDLALERGECWQHLKQYAKALEAYQAAIAMAEEGDAEDGLKLALYRAGVLATAMQHAEGPALLKRLVQLDPNYRDARARLAKVQGA